VKDYEKAFTDVKDRMRLYEKWRGHEARIMLYLEERKQEAQRLKEALTEKQENVDRLKGLTFSNLIHTVTGRKAEKIDERSESVLKAQLKYEEAEATINDLREELQEIHVYLDTLGTPEDEYQDLIQQKKQHLLTENHKALHALIEAASTAEVQMNEVLEAKEIGLQAKEALAQTLRSLDKASDWSTADMFGGGFLTTAFKHSYVDDARSDIHDVQRLLRKLEEELKDVNQFTSFHIQIDGFLTFADYFFDGLIVDWMVHGEIRDSYDKASSLLKEVKSVLTRLNQMEQELLADLQDVRRKKESYIVDA